MNSKSFSRGILFFLFSTLMVYSLPPSYWLGTPETMQAPLLPPLAAILGRFIPPTKIFRKREAEERRGGKKKERCGGDDRYKPVSASALAQNHTRPECSKVATFESTVDKQCRNYNNASLRDARPTHVFRLFGRGDLGETIAAIYSLKRRHGYPLRCRNRALILGVRSCYSAKT